MRWLCERGGPVGRFSQSLLLRSPSGLRQDDLAVALQALLDHHDALRLRLDAGGGAPASEHQAFQSSGPKDWTFEVLPSGSVRAPACLRRVDADDLDEDELRSLIRRRRRQPSFGSILRRGIWCRRCGLTRVRRGKAGCC